MFRNLISRHCLHRLISEHSTSADTTQLSHPQALGCTSSWQSHIALEIQGTEGMGWAVGRLFTTCSSSQESGAISQPPCSSDPLNTPSPHPVLFLSFSPAKHVHSSFFSSTSPGDIICYYSLQGWLLKGTFLKEDKAG